MEIVEISLAQLREHPRNANVMDERALAKLRAHIERHGHYEPLVVRAHRRETGCYELLNGHHRRRVLESLGRKTAACVVWQVDDAEALVLLATLNRLTGNDQPVKRGQLLAALGECFDEHDLTRKLPETRKQLQKALAAAAPVDPIAPADIGAQPEAMMFFVTKTQKQTIERALHLMKTEATGKAGEENTGRGERLAWLAEAVLAQSGAGGHAERGEENVC